MSWRSAREARRARYRAELQEFWRQAPEEPPRDSFAGRWRAHRGGTPRFVRAMGCIFGLFVLCAAFAGGTLATLLARAPGRTLPILAMAAFAAFLLVSGFIATLRRVAFKFRSQVLLRRQLLADVAHELRTPLAILQGRIEGQLDGVYPRSEEELQRLLDETRHLGRLVDDIGTLAHAEAGALELRKERVDLAELLADTAASFDRPIALVAPPDLPPIELDPLRIREVVLNLLTNAARHTPAQGTITIRVAAEARTVVLRVEDTGSGISPEELPNVFQRFHKGAGSKGSGLGLAIARDLVRAHGGNIQAESSVGRGTTVIVTLPR
jgi:signal transduction histidine kinase